MRASNRRSVQNLALAVTCALASACGAKNRPFEEASPIGGAGGPSEETLPSQPLPDAGEPEGGAPEPSATEEPDAGPTEPTGPVGPVVDPDADPPSVGPILNVETEVVDFGPVVLETAALGSLRLSNAGDAPLLPPDVVLADASDADFTLLQNLCTEPLEPGSECEVRIQFLPAEAGERAGAVLVSSGSEMGVSVPLVGSGLAPGELVLAPDANSSPDFGGVLLGQQSEGTFVVINGGDVPSGVLSILLVNPEFQLLEPGDGDCVPEQTNLAGGESCNLRVAFAPTVRGELAAATLTVASEEAGAASVGLAGSGLAAAELEVAPGVEFGSVVLGQNNRATLQLSNAGDVVLAVPEPSLEGEDASSFSLLENRCDQELAAGASCEMLLGFEPLREGSHVAALSLSSPDAPETAVELLGEGLRPGALAISTPDGVTPSEYDFGSVVADSTSDAQTFVVTNTGGVASGALDVSVANVSGGQFLRDAGGQDCVNGQTSLAPGASCEVSISFAPAGAGASEGSLTVTSDLAGSSGLSLRGTGLLAADLSLTSAGLLQFGQVVTDDQASETVTLRNDGDDEMSAPIVQVVATGSDLLAQFVADASDCAEPLGGGESCSIAVDFAPTRAGSHSASLQVSSGSAGDFSVALLGRAVLPGSLTLTPATAAFLALVGDQSASETFTVSNPGAASGPLSFNTSRDEFVVVPGGPNACEFNATNLAEGDSCTIEIAFSPTERVASLTGSLEVNSISAGTVTAQLRGTGQAAAQLSGARLNNFGLVNVGENSSFEWIVTNLGDVASGTLLLSPVSSADFRVTDNACSGDLSPASSCSVVVAFAPQSGGAHDDQLRLQGDGVELTLELEGTGRQLQQPGEACAGSDASQCARAGDVCSFNHGTTAPGAICCEEQCDNLCETCNASGSCVPLGNGSSCGDDLVCQGTQCRKEDGIDCVGGAECASSICDGASDICCAQSCGGGQRCNADGNGCELIPAGQGDACSNTPCEAGLTCVDGVCCNESCNGSCESCALPGSVGECRGIGEGADCSLNQAQCRAEGCLFENSASCSDDDDCDSGSCADGVCCNDACAGLCEACNLPNQVGSCSSEANGTSCGNGLACQNGQCRRNDGESCTVDSDCVNSCDSERNICCAQACGFGERCSVDGAACERIPLALGEECTGPGLCQAGLTCVDGVCCERACTGVCEACDLPNQRGSCSNVANGTSCGGGLACQAGQCLSSDGVACSGDSDCINVCDDERRICCAQACGAGQRCNVQGTGCEAIPLGGGAACANSTQCQAGLVCADGVCCESACNGTCQACNLPGLAGTCSIDVGALCSGEGERCQANGACDFNVCVLDQSLVGQCRLAP